MKTLLTIILLFIANISFSQFDTIKNLSNQNVLTLQDTKTKEFHFVFKADGLTDAQFIEMRKSLEIALMFYRIYK